MSIVIQRTTATSGTVTVIDTGQDVHLCHIAGLTLALTVSFPATPQDGQRITVHSEGGITVMSTTTPVGTMSSGSTGVGGNNSVEYVWIKSNSRWYKIR